VGVGGSGSSLAPSTSDLGIWSLIAVPNSSPLVLSFVPWMFGSGLNSCIELSEGATNTSTEVEGANLGSVDGAVSSGLVSGKTGELSWTPSNALDSNHPNRHVTRRRIIYTALNRLVFLFGNGGAFTMSIGSIPFQRSPKKNDP
jgi:hypothetical protein